MCQPLLYLYRRSEPLSGDVLTGCWVCEESSISHTVQNQDRVVIINYHPTTSHYWYSVKFTDVCSSGNLHVLSDRCVADSVGGSRDGCFAAITAPTAVQTGHVDPVEVIMVLPSSVAQGLVLTVFIIPARSTKESETTTTTRGTLCPIWAMTKEHRNAMWSRFALFSVTFCFSSITAWGREEFSAVWSQVNAVFYWPE